MSCSNNSVYPHQGLIKFLFLFLLISFGYLTYTIHHSNNCHNPPDDLGEVEKLIALIDSVDNKLEEFGHSIAESSDSIELVGAEVSGAIASNVNDENIDSIKIYLLSILSKELEPVLYRLEVSNDSLVSRLKDLYIVSAENREVIENYSNEDEKTFNILVFSSIPMLTFLILLCLALYYRHKWIMKNQQIRAEKEKRTFVYDQTLKIGKKFEELRSKIIEKQNKLKTELDSLKRKYNRITSKKHTVAEINLINDKITKIRDVIIDIDDFHNQIPK